MPQNYSNIRTYHKNAIKIWHQLRRLKKCHLNITQPQMPQKMLLKYGRTNSNATNSTTKI